MKVVNLSERNSLLNQYLKEIRSIDIQKDSLRFRRNIERIGEVMAYEISKRLNYKTVTVQTPLAPCDCRAIADNVVLGTILRAGLPFHQGFLSYFDDAENSFVSAYRKYKEKEHFDIHIEYIASPRLDDKTLILVDPMLATGASMDLAYQALLTKGTPERIHIASVIASKQAIDYIKAHFPEDKTTVWVGTIDEVINSHSYIVPGLGDAGDLAFGIKE